MRAHNVIIVASGRVSYAHGSDLDALIRAIVALKKQPILVLGPDGDDLLRVCQEAESCEMIFDPNFNGEIFSSIKAGLQVCSHPALVLPFAAKMLEPSEWVNFEKYLADAESATHVLKPVLKLADESLTQNNDTLQWCHWPQIVTAHGVRVLKNLPATTSWTDAEIILTKSIDLPANSATPALG
jgi:hypothetical protein